MRLDEMLGFDPDDPQDHHAELLVEEHDAMLRALIAQRIRLGLEQKDIAKVMGIDPSGISKIESGDRDLRLSTLRRYAFACGAVIRHDVEDFEAIRRREAAMRALPPYTAEIDPWQDFSAFVGSAKPHLGSWRR